MATATKDSQSEYAALCQVSPPVDGGRGSARSGDHHQRQPGEEAQDDAADKPPSPGPIADPGEEVVSVRDDAHDEENDVRGEVGELHIQDARPDRLDDPDQKGGDGDDQDQEDGSSRFLSTGGDLRTSRRTSAYSSAKMKSATANYITPVPERKPMTLGPGAAPPPRFPSSTYSMNGVIATM